MSPDWWNAQGNWMLECLKSMFRHTWNEGQKLRRSNTKSHEVWGFLPYQASTGSDEPDLAACLKVQGKTFPTRTSGDIPHDKLDGCW